jgi:hypothetical protein
MSTNIFRKYIDFINEAQQLDELSPDLLRRASDAAGAKRTSLAGPENKAARQKASGQEEKFYQGQVDRSQQNPVAGNQATFNSYKDQLTKNGWKPVANQAQAQQVMQKLRVTDPGTIVFANGSEYAALSPQGNFQRTKGTAQGGARFGTGLNPGVDANRRWNPAALPGGTDTFVATEDVTEGLGDTLKFAWRELKTNVVDFVANAVGLPNDQRREVFVQAGNEFSNEVIKLLANHPARDKLIPMVREIGGYMAKARTLEELKSLMDKAGLFLADVDAGKFDPPSGVAKTLPSYSDKQGVAEDSNLSNITLNLTQPQAALLLEVLLGSYQSKSHKEYIRPITAQIIDQGITAGYDKKTLKKWGSGQQGVAE